MMKTKNIAPVFHVSDLSAALHYYTEVLGFTEEFRVDGYVGVRLGEARLHLALSGDYQRPVGGGSAYIFCDSVDDYFAGVTAKNAKLRSAPVDSPYGMRDFVVCDRDGNQLSFGADNESEHPAAK